MDDVLLAEICRKKQELQEKQVLVCNTFSDCSAELFCSIEKHGDVQIGYG